MNQKRRKKGRKEEREDKKERCEGGLTFCFLPQIKFSEDYKVNGRMKFFSDS